MLCDRYEQGGRVGEVVEALGRNADQADLVSAMTQYAGAAVRAGNLFGSKNIFTKVINFKKTMGLQVC